MVVSATSSLALALTGAETLVAKSAAMQSRTGKTEAEIKTDHIFYGQEHIPLESIDGAVLADDMVVLFEASHGFNQIGQGVRYQMGANGGIVVAFRSTARHAHDQKDSQIDFLNWCCGVVDDMTAMFGRDTDYPFNRVDMLEPPQRTDITTRGPEDVWFASWILYFSVEN